ncbi:hypothetical protein Ct61P_14463 [Colletotrichum tofieldiae]|nr:hypothetical protein Ct61P_14463 [Colletotrichum tofieldiae]
MHEDVCPHEFHRNLNAIDRDSTRKSKQPLLLLAHPSLLIPTRDTLSHLNVHAGRHKLQYYIGNARTDARNNRANAREGIRLHPMAILDKLYCHAVIMRHMDRHITLLRLSYPNSVS